MDPWRNGSASDSRSEGCVFDSRRVQIYKFHFIFVFFPPLIFVKLMNNNINAVSIFYILLSKLIFCSEPLINIYYTNKILYFF